MILSVCEGSYDSTSVNCAAFGGLELLKDNTGNCTHTASLLNDFISEYTFGTLNADLSCIPNGLLKRPDEGCNPVLAALNDAVQSYQVLETTVCGANLASTQPRTGFVYVEFSSASTCSQADAAVHNIVMDFASLLASSNDLRRDEIIDFDFECQPSSGKMMVKAYVDKDVDTDYATVVAIANHIAAAGLTVVSGSVTFTGESYGYGNAASTTPTTTQTSSATTSLTSTVTTTPVDGKLYCKHISIVTYIAVDACAQQVALLNSITGTCNAVGAPPATVECKVVAGQEVLYSDNCLVSSKDALNEAITQFSRGSFIGSLECTVDGFLKESSGTCETNVYHLNRAIRGYDEGIFDSCFLTTPTTTPTTTITSTPTTSVTSTPVSYTHLTLPTIYSV